VAGVEAGERGQRCRADAAASHHPASDTRDPRFDERERERQRRLPGGDNEDIAAANAIEGTAILRVPNET